jgi:hypothetical protein
VASHRTPKVAGGCEVDEQSMEVACTLEGTRAGVSHFGLLD